MGEGSTDCGWPLEDPSLPVRQTQPMPCEGRGIRHVWGTKAKPLAAYRRRLCCLAAIYIAANVASQPEPLVALIKVTKKHEHITVAEPSLGIWTSLGSRGVAPQMRDQAAYLTLGGGAGGRSLGSI